MSYNAKLQGHVQACWTLSLRHEEADRICDRLILAHTHTHRHAFQHAGCSMLYMWLSKAAQ
eukprot:2802147-Amphidinium_carterae.1